MQSGSQRNTNFELSDGAIGVIINGAQKGHRSCRGQRVPRHRRDLDFQAQAPAEKLNNSKNEQIKIKKFVKTTDSCHFNDCGKTQVQVPNPQGFISVL